MGGGVNNGLLEAVRRNDTALSSVVADWVRNGCFTSPPPPQFSLVFIWPETVGCTVCFLSSFVRRHEKGEKDSGSRSLYRSRPCLCESGPTAVFSRKIRKLSR